VTSTAELAARRLALLARCEAQRAELTSRIAQLSPRRWTRAAGGAVGVAGTAARSGRHPLAWLLALAAMVFLKNPRYALALLGRTRTALTWATRAAEVLSLLGALRKTTLRRTASSKTALRRAR
jgi:hypothetical protein